MLKFYLRFFFLIFFVFPSLLGIAQDNSSLSALYPSPEPGEKPYVVIADLNKRLLDDPYNVELLAQRAMQYTKVNDYDYAFRDMQQAISLAPEDHTLYFRLSLIYYKKKAYDDCIRQLNIALGLDNNNQDYLFLRSMAYSMNTQYINAVNDATLLSELNPLNTDAYMLCGKLYERLGLYYYSFHSYYLFLKYEMDDKANRRLVQQHLAKMKKADPYFKKLIKKAKKEVFSKKKK